MSVAGTFSPITTTFGGSGQMIQGGVGYKNVIVSGHASFGGTSTVDGNLTAATSSGVLDINGKDVTVNGNYTSAYQDYYTGGTLVMKNPSGVLRVLGNVNFDGNPTDTLLTAGTMYVGGNFRVGKNFTATGTHQVVFNGSSVQSINEILDRPHSHFSGMRISNAAGVAINTNVLAGGNLRMDSSASLSGTGSLLVKGAVTTFAGSSVTVTSLELDSTMSVLGTFSPTTTTFGGSGQMIQGGVGYKNVIVSGHALFGGTSTVDGNLTAATSSGVLDINGKDVTVNGNYTSAYQDYYTGGTLVMKNPSGVLRVLGNVNFDGNPTDTLLTAGTMYVGGNFRVGKNFTATGTHQVVFNGSSVQSINEILDRPHSHFSGMRISNAAGVAINTNVLAGGNLRMDSSASLSGTGSLIVNGTVTTFAGSSVTVTSLELDSTMSVLGTFSPTTTTFGGSGQMIQGGVGYKNVIVSGHASFGGTSTVDGNLTAATSSGVLDINGKDVTVNGNYTSAYQDYYTGGTLVMKNPSGVLRVMGNVNFDGNPTDTLLTAGTMYVGGNFRVGKNFTATGTHQVVFNGSSVQSINEILDHPHSHFSGMRISNAAGVAINTNVLAGGNLRMDSSASLSGTGSLIVNGTVTTFAGSSVTVTSLELDSTMSVLGTFSPTTTTFGGSGQMIQGGVGYKNVIVSGHASFGGTSTVDGNLTAATSSGVLDINGKDVTVNGNYTSAYQDYYTGGTLVMKNPSGVLRVLGNVNFDGNPTDTLLTAGTMYVGGNFRVGKNFTATGTHQVVFNGSSVQSINEILDRPHSHFSGMRISNAAGVAINTNVLAGGNLRMDSSASLSGTGSLIVNGTVTTFAGSSVTVTSLELDSTMSVLGTFSPTTTTFGGSGQMIQGGVGYKNVIVSGHASFGGTSTVDGNLTAATSSGVLDINGKDVTVNGNYTSAYQDYYTGGTLVMKNPSGVLRVMGNVNFDGNPTDTLLTAGTMYVGGTFRVGKNFSASGTHKVIFNGSSAQAINEFYSPPASHFQDLEVANPSGLNITTSVRADGNLKLDSSALLTGTGSLVVKGAVTTFAGSSVTVTSLELDSAMSVLGTFSPTTTTFGGSGQMIQGLPGYKHVIVSGHALFGGTSTVDGNLTAANPSGVLDINGKDVTVNGNYTSAYQDYYTGGTLVMKNPSGVLRVLGNVNFDGNPTDTLLTAGTMYVGGNFTLNKNFSGSGSHKVVFNGSSRQSVSGYFGANNHFNGLQISNPSGIALNADVIANGQLISHPSLHSTARNRGILASTADTPDSIFGGGHSLTVGGLDIDSLTLDGVRLIDEGGTLANFNTVVFRNNNPTVTQFTIHHPGAPNAFAFDGLKFLSTPSTGYYISATDNHADGNVLTINLISSVPHDGSGRTLVSGGALVNWGINAPPILASVSPVLVRRGEKTSIILNGSNFFDSVTTVTFGAGIITDSLTFNSSSQIGAHVTVMDSAGIGTRNVSVTNQPPGGGTAALQNALTVGYPRPTISRIIPDSANRIQTLSFVIRGRKFSQALTSVNFGGNIAINSKSVNSDTQVTIGATIGANAAAGSRNVIVTNISPGGGSDTLKNGLLIMNPAPSLSSVAPPAATRGQSASVLLTGLYFFAGTTGVIFGDSIAVNSMTVNDSAHLTANISIAPGAALGLRGVTVTNSPPGGGSTTLSNAFTVQDSAITLQIGEGNGWNMVSVPAVVSDFHKNSLYPGAVSKAFSFQGAYVVQDLLENGVGYWIKFPSATTISFTGSRIEVDSVPVMTGWNMIGTLSHPVLRTNVLPAGTAMVSRFFGYTNSYHVSDTLFPGRAYWIKVSQAGKLVLKVNSVVAVPGISEKGSAARCTSGADASTPIEKGLGRLTVRDALGKAQTLD